MKHTMTDVQRCMQTVHYWSTTTTDQGTKSQHIFLYFFISISWRRTRYQCMEILHCLSI